MTTICSHLLESLQEAQGRCVVGQEGGGHTWREGACRHSSLSVGLHGAQVVMLGNG